MSRQPDAPQGRPRNEPAGAGSERRGQPPDREVTPYPNAPRPAPPWRVEGRRPNDPPSPGQAPPRRSRWAWLWLAVLFGLLAFNWLGSSDALGPPASATVPYTFFSQQVTGGNVSEITATGNAIEGKFKKAVTPPGTEAKVSNFGTHRPDFAHDDLYTRLVDKGVVVNAKAPAGAPLWEQLLVGLLPTLLLVGLLVWAGRRMRAAGGMGGLGGIGRSRAKRYDPEAGPRATFADVAGIDEVENELNEMVDFLKHPERYRRLGARMPKGVLLSGLPGTGKTLLARAMAGEASVPFYSISASEFIEMIVGVGASRVRDLFAQAKATAPSIIFIDEIDAIGRTRGGSLSVGGHDEREQTLNQILTEMDGFVGNEEVVVVAATNRPEILDPALLRAGRFDRRLVINPPDTAGRRQILDVHVRGVPLSGDVDLDAVAATTPGMTGADLKNLVNEAALAAARRPDADTVAMRDFTSALEGILLGAARSIVLGAEERRRTAYHEAGHALVGMLTSGADPVRKISIIPRGHALGVTLQTPEADRYTHSASELRGRISGALAGRAAEELVFGDTSTGSESDLEVATRLGRQMVGRWGMSERIGAMSVLPDAALGPGFGFDGSGPSPQTLELVDAESRRVLEECYESARAVLADNRGRLDALASALLDRETLDAEDAYAAAGLAPA